MTLQNQKGLIATEKTIKDLLLIGCSTVKWVRKKINNCLIIYS